MVNRIYCGDNLRVMAGLPAESVDMVYADPPYNSNAVYKGKDGSEAEGVEFADRYKWKDVDVDYLEGLRGRRPELGRLVEVVREVHSDRLAAYFVYMLPRLEEIYRVLKQSGSFYWHVDYASSHYAKAVMDGVFGAEHFRNDLIWSYSRFSRTGRRFPIMNDTILFYVKSPSYTFHPPLIEDPELKPMHARGWSIVVDSGVKKLLVYDRSKSEDRVAEAEKEGIPIVYSSTTYPKIGNVWTDVPILSGSSTERTGFPTQKPVALLERLIKASTNAGEVVLDPFCGSGTTLVAADLLSRQWIGIDIHPRAMEVVEQRIDRRSGLFARFEKVVVCSTG